MLHGQGTVNFSNFFFPTPFVYDDRFGTDLKAAVGTTFSVALYWAPADPLNPNVQPAGSAFTQRGPSGNIGPVAGVYSVGVVTIPGITPPGGYAWFQVKAWETSCGSTFEQASAMAAPVGVSSLIDIRTGDPSTGGSPPLLTGIGPIHVGLLGPPFSDPCVPEPSALLLGFFGAAILFLVSPKRKRS
jgi:hypothetical protein